MSRFQHGHHYPFAPAFNHAPTDITLSGSHDVTENSVPGTVIGTFTVTDQDALDSFTYSLADTMGGRFAINGKNLVTGTTNIDYESTVPPQYDLSVTVKDAAGATFTNTITVFVLDGPESPYDISLSNTHIYENQAINTNFIQITGYDPDAGDSLTFSITSDPDNKFAISGGDWLQLANPLDYETKTAHTLTIRATDSTGLSYDQTFVFDVINVNEAPNSIALSNTVAESGTGNGTLVGWLSATDPDVSQTFHYSIASDPDGKFMIANGNGLYLSNTVDAAVKSSHSVTVTVTDQGGLSYSQPFNITVATVDHAPTDIQLSSTQVFENSPDGTLVGTLTATDPDAGDTFTYAVSNDPNAMFTITGNGLYTRNQASWTMAAHPSGVGVQIRVYDAANQYYDKTFTITMKTPNAAPTDITTSPSPVAVAENVPIGTTVCTLQAVDPNAGDTFTYTLNTATGKFVISGNKLQTIDTLDWSVASSYTLNVTATDQGGLSFSKDIPVTVNQYWFPPTDITLSKNTVQENAAIGTVIGNLTAIDADGSTSTLSISADPDGKFSIANGNQLVSKATFDYTVKTAHSVTILATDTKRGTFSKTFTINVAQVYFAPTDITLSATSVDETTTVGSVVAVISVVDQDNSADTLTLASDPDGKFSISGNNLILAASVSVAEAASHNISITATDPVRGAITKPFTIQVVKNNHAPTSISLSGDHKVVDGAPEGTLIGTLTSTDADVGDTATYSLAINDFSAFSITGNQLFTANASQWSSAAHPAGLGVTVRVTDSAGAYFDQQFSITFKPANHAPTDITTSPSPATVSENAAIGSVVCTLGATDQDVGDTATFTITSDPDNKFALNGNQLLLNGLLDYTVATSHNVTIQVTDSAGATYSKPLTIAVTQYYVPATDITISSNTVAENASVGTVIGTLGVVDPDGSSSTFAISSDPDGKFDLANGNQLISKATFDWSVKTSHNVTIIATDSDGRGTFTKTLTINVSQVYFAPTNITLSNNSIPEDTTVGSVVATISVTDPDNSVDSLSLSSNIDGKFSISGNQLMLAQAVNYATADHHNISILATDPVRGSYTKAFTIFVTHVNHAPTDIALSGTHAMNENVGAGTFVGNLSTTDPDAGDTFTYTISADPNAMFQVSGNVLQTKNPANWNYEARTSTTVTVRVTDQGGLYFEKTFTITINNVNEAPTSITTTPSGAITVNEDQPVGTLVCTLGSTDPDAGDTATYSISSDPSAKFVLQNGNEVHLNATLDYTVATSHTLGITVTDSGGLTYTQSFTINVGRVWYPPYDIAISSASIAENNAVGALIGTLSCSDVNSPPETGYTYAITSDPDSAFTLQNGNELHAAVSYNYEQKASHSVTIRCTDPVRGYYDKTLAIAITNVNEAPTAITLDNLTISNSAVSGALVGNLTTTDPDVGDTFTYTITSDSSGGDFAISGAKLVTAIANVPSGTYNVTIQTTDSGGLSCSNTFAIVSQAQQDPATAALISAMTVKPTTTRQTQIDTCITALKSAGVWDLLDIFYMTAAHDQQASTLNWKNPSSFTLAAIGSPSFTVDQGWVGVSTTNKLNTGFNPTTAAGRVISQNNCSVHAYVKPNSTTLQRCAGNVGLSVLDRSGAKGQMECGANTTAAVYSGASTSYQGFFQSRRTDSGSMTCWLNLGSSGFATSAASVAFANTTMDICGGGSNSTTNASVHQVRFFAAGAGMTDQQITSVHDAVLNFLTSIGANLTTNL